MLQKPLCGNQMNLATLRTLKVHHLLLTEFDSTEYEVRFILMFYQLGWFERDRLFCVRATEVKSFTL